MPRLKITEYKAKQLILGAAYEGRTFGSQGPKALPKGRRFVVKVDQGVKKRFVKGLVALDQPPKNIAPLMKKWQKLGYTRFLLEPFVPHAASDERYLSLERVRDGIRVLFAKHGGIDIESHAKEIETFVIAKSGDVQRIAESTSLPETFLQNLLTTFEKNHFVFCELNPIVIEGSDVHILDAAVLVDSAGVFFVTDDWSADVVAAKAAHPAEARVLTLAKTTPASLKLTVLHPNGGLFFLLSGGGGSIVIADEAALQGKGALIGNYGEYSGGPTREETHLYAKEVINLMLNSSAKKKALVIAGGVANFTDVLITFDGIVDALGEQADRLRAQKVKVFVRRGGPNEAMGLARMETYLQGENLLGSVYGSEAIITAAVSDALEYLS